MGRVGPSRARESGRNSRDSRRAAARGRTRARAGKPAQTDTGWKARATARRGRLAPPRLTPFAARVRVRCGPILRSRGVARVNLAFSQTRFSRSKPWGVAPGYGERRPSAFGGQRESPGDPAAFHAVVRFQFSVFSFRSPVARRRSLGIGLRISDFGFRASAFRLPPSAFRPLNTGH